MKRSQRSAIIHADDQSAASQSSMATAGSRSRGGARDLVPSTWSRRALFRGIPLRREAGTGFWTRVSRPAMACRFEITLASEDAGWVPAARAALDEVDRIEDRLTVFRDTSLVSGINRRAASAPVGIDDDLLALLERCAALHEATGGAFDPTSTPLSRFTHHPVRRHPGTHSIRFRHPPRRSGATL